MAGEIAKIDDVYIPNVIKMPLTPQLLADESRTADNTMQRDIAGNGEKRQWKITASKLTMAERDAILTLLRAKHHGAVAFWLDEFGDESATIQAYVTIGPIERLNLWRNGVWGVYTMELTITEK